MANSATTSSLAPADFQQVIDRSDSRHISQRLLSDLLFIVRTDGTGKHDGTLRALHLDTDLLQVRMKIKQLCDLSCESHGETVIVESCVEKFALRREAEIQP